MTHDVDFAHARPMLVGDDHCGRDEMFERIAEHGGRT